MVWNSNPNDGIKMSNFIIKQVAVVEGVLLEIDREYHSLAKDKIKWISLFDTSGPQIQVFDLGDGGTNVTGLAL